MKKLMFINFVLLMIIHTYVIGCVELYASNDIILVPYGIIAILYALSERRIFLAYEEKLEKQEKQ